MRKSERIAPVADDSRNGRESNGEETDLSKTNMDKELRRYHLTKKVGRRASSTLMQHSATLKKGRTLIVGGTQGESKFGDEGVGEDSHSLFTAFLADIENIENQQNPTPELSKLNQSDSSRGKALNFSKMKSQRLRQNPRYQNAKCIVFPDDPLKIFWNFLMIISILYSVVITPLTAAFPDSFERFWKYPEYALDFVFIFDILFNLLVFAYKLDDGVCIVDHKKIALSYLMGWFLIDIFSAVPLNWIELFTNDIMNNNVQNFARYLKLPRIYRIFRLTRVAKLLKEKKEVYSLSEFLKMPPGFERLISSLSFNLVVFHVVCCLWITLASTDQDNPDNWILRLGFLDESAFDLYIISFYWTVQTVFTVGTNFRLFGLTCK